MKDLQVPCIVCGQYIIWDDSPMPAACATHSYQEVFEVYDEAAQQQADGAIRVSSIESEVSGIRPKLNIDYTQRVQADEACLPDQHDYSKSLECAKCGELLF